MASKEDALWIRYGGSNMSLFSLASSLFLLNQLRMVLILCYMKEIMVYIKPYVPGGQPEALNIQKHFEKLEGKGQKTSTLQCRHAC